ncbi:unnamed protein product, partial [Brassica rapa]
TYKILYLVLHVMRTSHIITALVLFFFLSLILKSHQRIIELTDSLGRCSITVNMKSQVAQIPSLG